MFLKLGPVLVVDERSSWDGRWVTLTLREEGIQQIEPAPPGEWYISPGWVDGLCWSGQPQDVAEPLAQLAHRAMKGGFTTIWVGGWHGWEEEAILEEIAAQRVQLPVAIHFIAAWADKQGKITPIESLRERGAAGWSLPPLHIMPWRTLARCLPYLRHVGGVVFCLPYWEGAEGEGGVPDAPDLALSGWQGIPEYAETAAIHLIAEVAQHWGGSIAVGPITTAKGLRLARTYGLHVFTAIPYLVADTTKLSEYDAFWKLHPPLRTTDDRKALLEAIWQSDMDMIVSWDYAASPEEKDKEWKHAGFGQRTLEIGVALLWNELWNLAQGRVSLTHLVRAMSEKPRRLLGLPPCRIEVGQPLDFTVFRLKPQPTPLPPPWDAHSSALEVGGIIRRLADADSLRSQRF